MLGKRKKSEEEQTGQGDRSDTKLAKSNELMSIHKQDSELFLPVEILSKILSIFFRHCETVKITPFLEMRRCCKLFNDIVIDLVETKVRKHVAGSDVSKYMSLGDYFERMNRLGINYKRNLARFIQTQNYQLFLDCDLFKAPDNREAILERDAKIPLGASKFGGWPHLPNDWEYPQVAHEWDTTPRNVEFMMQVKLLFSFPFPKTAFLPFVWQRFVARSFWSMICVV